jgi:hypothetical protein
MRAFFNAVAVILGFVGGLLFLAAVIGLFQVFGVIARRPHGAR